MLQKNCIHFFCSLVLSLLIILPVFSQQIIPDGRTNTNLAVNGKVTNVTTSTMHGNNALNSFSKFNVNAGNVVNLHEPSNAARLINLVRDQRTDINGILNGIKNGHVGGNIYFVNPYGVFVGQSGIVNVGSLTVITPYRSEMDTFYNTQKGINPNAVNRLLNKQMGVNPDAQVVNYGKINAQTNVNIDTGIANNFGKITTAAVYRENNIAMGDVVNINGAEASPTIVKYNGNIIINGSKQIFNNGILSTDGGTNIAAGHISLISKVIYTNNLSNISARGKGKASSGGNILLNASYIVSNSSRFDSSAGETGNAGSINLLSSVYDCLSNLDFKANAAKGSNNVTLEAPTQFLKGYFKSNGANLNIKGSNIIEFLDNTNITTKNVDSKNVSLSKSGNVNILTPCMYFVKGKTTIDTSANNQFNSGNIQINTDLIGNLRGTKHIINAGNANLFINRRTPGDININDGNYYSPYTGTVYGDPGMFASKSNFDLLAQKISLGITTPLEDFTTQNLNLNLDLSSNGNISLGGSRRVFLNKNVTAKNVNIMGGAAITGPGKVSASENITLNSVNGQIGDPENYLKVDEGSNGTLTTNSKLNTWLYETSGDMRINELKSGNDIYLLTNANILNAKTSNDYNIIANNLFVIRKASRQFSSGNYYMFGIDDDPFNNNVQTSVFDIYKQLFKSKGQNWASMPESNFKLFDDDKGSYTKSDILTSLKDYASKTSKNDMLFIMYEGHGGTTNGGSGNTYKSYLGLKRFSISDEEFASAVSGAKGTIVFFTDQCFGGGMFGGSNDIDKVAIRNGFKFFGLTGTDETHYAWATAYSDVNYSYTGFLHINLLNSATKTNSSFWTYNPTTRAYETYNNSYAFNVNGNLYLNEWHNAINKRDTFYVPYCCGTIYPYMYKKFTNMTSTDLASTPIVIKNWNSGSIDNSIVTKNIGSASKPLKVNLKGKVTADINGTSYISGIQNNAANSNSLANYNRSLSASSMNLSDVVNYNFVNANASNVNLNTIIQSTNTNIKTPTILNLGGLQIYPDTNCPDSQNIIYDKYLINLNTDNN